jgi:hypothetical protein
MNKLSVAVTLATAALLSACTTTLTKPGASNQDFQRDLAACEYEAEKYGHTDMWGSTGAMAGFEEGMRKNKLTRMCMAQKGWTPQ